MWNIVSIWSSRISLFIVFPQVERSPREQVNVSDENQIRRLRNWIYGGCSLNITDGRLYRLQMDFAHEFISRASFVSNRSSQAFVGDVWSDELRSERKRKREGSSSSEGDCRACEGGKRRVCTRARKMEREREQPRIRKHANFKRHSTMWCRGRHERRGALRRRMQIQIEHDKLLLSSHPVFRTSL